ncbi:hypothetical protein BUALT_Bualt09G0060200 [Buddleja alternifolia]|uniref:Uncharacterized protein n=1 Tax=Buddleja alternifolia TaxID=168488 RepID=A0AAV6WZN8_9LAMI|nr:hypothetical protein BUALT_Bualt09G0060200 [Buddleja alternifolia]
MWTPRKRGIVIGRIVNSSPIEGERYYKNDIIAIVIDKVEQRPVITKYGISTIQEFFVINEERMPMMLSLWNDVFFIEEQDLVATSEKMPIIATTIINIVDYNGISLAARGFVSIVVNPPYPQTQFLRDWRSRNHTYLTQLVKEKKILETTYFSVNSSLEQLFIYCQCHRHHHCSSITINDDVAGSST